MCFLADLVLPLALPVSLMCMQLGVLKQGSGLVDKYLDILMLRPECRDI
jgi:hypothetical protein